ncbi:MAG: amidase [Verrucomicrobiaceae bacterium]|nr:MAG: amidase [Verrucomicrobiaceae bacterium]
MNPSPITVSQSKAFVATFELPPTGSGPLDGLCFAVKDLIDIAGWKTACGNPAWRDTHPPAVAHAVCVEQLLQAGARCVGKTVSDEMAFSLLGQNHFYGTPLNPHAPDRVPGGSSSGSASAVACGLVDFALGTDTGGSVRVPAGNCGILGLRPSHGFISMAGVNPLAPSFDTVGIFAGNPDVLARVSNFLLSTELAVANEPETVYVVRDAFTLADEEIRHALMEPVRMLRERFGDRLRDISLSDIDGETTGENFETWRDTYCVLQWAEITSCLGAWIADAKPEFGPATAASFELTNRLDRGRIAGAVERRERYFRRLRSFFGPRDLLCMPTAPALPLRLGDPLPDRSAKTSGNTYYPRALSLTSVAGIGRLPQVSLPISPDGVPVGLSLLAAHGQDAFLLEVARILV